MFRKKYIISLSIISFLIVICLVGASYAYFSASVNGNTNVKETVITTGQMALKLSDGEYVTLENAIPGSSVTKTFKVKNTGTVATTYDVYLSEIINTFIDKNDLVYTLSSTNGCENTSQSVVASKSGNDSKIVAACAINPNLEHEYTLTINFKEDNTNQDDNKGRKFNAKISVNEYKTIDNLIASYGDATTVGDIVEYGNETFYVIDFDSSNNKVSLIPKYVLNVSNSNYVQDENDILLSSSNGISGSDEVINSYLNNYKNQLVNKGFISSTDNVRLLNMSDLNKYSNRPNFLYNTASYWLGNKNNNNVLYMKLGNELDYGSESLSNIGFRPVIEVSRSNIVLDNRAHYGIWIWKNSLDDILVSSSTMDESIELLKTNGFNEVYVSILPANLEDSSSIEYISKLNKANIKVYTLYGDVDFVNPQISNIVIDSFMQSVADFNTNHLGSAYLEGIHYDVEYQGYLYDGVNRCPYGQSEEAKNCISRKYYVDFVKNSYTKARELNLKVGQDVSAYTTNMASYYDNGVELNVLDEIIDYADSFTIMAYNNTPSSSLYSVLYSGLFNHESGGSIYLSKSMADKLNEHNKGVYVGQELDTYKSAYQRLLSDPSYGQNYLAEYETENGNRYEYSWSFANEMFRDIESQLRSRNINKYGITVHNYKMLSDLLS